VETIIPKNIIGSLRYFDSAIRLSIGSMVIVVVFSKRRVRIQNHIVNEQLSIPYFNSILAYTDKSLNKWTLRVFWKLKDNDITSFRRPKAVDEFVYQDSIPFY